MAAARRRCNGSSQAGIVKPSCWQAMPFTTPSHTVGNRGGVCMKNFGNCGEAGLTMGLVVANLTD